MTALSTVIGRGTTAAKPAAAAVPVGALYYDTTLERMQRSTGAAWEDCDPTAGAGTGDVTYAQLLAMQVQNEIKGWPAVVKTGDLDALNLWWDKVGTPTTAPSIVAGNDGGITLQYNEVLKVVADGANEGLSQRWTYADEPRVKSGRVLSTLWAIWCVAGVGVTAKLVNSDASETAAAKVTAAAWTVVEVPNHTLAGTYCDVTLTTDGAGTFYAVPLGANIGARGLPLKPRGLRYVDTITVTFVVDNVDPGGAGYTDADFTAATSPLTAIINLTVAYINSTTAGRQVYLRRNGSTGDLYSAIAAVVAQAARSTFPLACDDGQIVEYKTTGTAGETENVYLSAQGYWEWE